MDALVIFLAWNVYMALICLALVGRADRPEAARPCLTKVNTAPAEGIVIRRSISNGFFTRAALDLPRATEMGIAMNSYVPLLLICLIGAAAFAWGYVAGRQRRQKGDRNG